jgi:hypothetical protein
VVFLLPFAILYNRMLDSHTFLVPMLLVTAAVFLWSLIRLLNALRTGFAITVVQVYSGAIGLIAVIVSVSLVVLQNSLGVFTYLQYFNHVFGK